MNYLFDESEPPLDDPPIDTKKFNGDISQWNTENVEDMSWMFQSSQFNGDISRWNVENVEIMEYMFNSSQFNGDISQWNVRSLIDVSDMFRYSQFKGDLTYWIPTEGCLNTFLRCGISENLPLYFISSKIKLFNSPEHYIYSLYWNWLRPNKVINRFRLEEALDYYDGDPSKIDQLEGFTIQ